MRALSKGRNRQTLDRLAFALHRIFFLLFTDSNINFTTSMSVARPQHEDDFVKKYLEKEIQALAIDSDLQQMFINFAVKEAHADPSKFKARLYHIVNGRTPSAYIALLLSDFFQKRKYEQIVRKVIDHVEYITPDGNTDHLEKFVNEHPLQLRILKVKNQEHVVIVVLRTPITAPNWDALSQDESDRQYDGKRREFERWLNAQGPLPETINLPSGLTKLEYWPDAIEPRYPGEFTFEEISNSSATLDISDGVDLLLLCSLKDKAPCVNPQMLDLFYSLLGVLGNDWSNKSAEKYSTVEIWQKLTKETSCLPHVFFQEQIYFSPKLASVLRNFFHSFAKKHNKLAKRALADWADLDRLGESYKANSENFSLYETARQDYAEALRPVLNKNKKQIVNALLKVIKIYRERAQKHFSKLRETFEPPSAE